jgi:GH15 family glucan-1,4-alpha-glucosidase
MSTRQTPTATPQQGATDDTGSSQPIGAYGLLADCNTAALADSRGSIDWLCLPRYDSPAVFARILDPDAGHWSIRPMGRFTTSRRYLPGTLVLETTFVTEDGVIRLTDALVFADGQRGHALGQRSPRELLRLLEGISGKVALAMELVPRPEYGLVYPLFRATEHGGRTFGGPNQIAVCVGVPVEIEDSTMRATLEVGEGDSVGFAMRWVPPQADGAQPTAAEGVARRIEDTVEGWRSWEAEHDVYEGPHRELVRLSSRWGPS